MSNQNHEKSISTWLIILFQGIVVILSIAIGYFGHNIIHRYRGNLALLQEAREILLANTILEVPPDPALEYGMINGMLGVMDDPYTNFSEPPAHQVLTDELAGRYSGVGVRLERDSQANWRLYPLPDSPAITAGIQDGDLLLGVDDLTVTTHTDEITLMAAMRGPEGETVILTIQREAEQRSISIQRQFVPLP
jgi:carboxyl-terminal processing protease